MRDLTPPEVRAFLEAGTRTGALATVRSDGRPHVAPVWYVLDGEEIVFTTWHSSVKGQNLRRAGRAAVTVDLEEPPYAFVAVEGPVVISEDPAELLAFATRIAGRYMGDDLAAEYGVRNSVDGELLVRLRMEHLVAKTDVSS